MAKVTAVLVEDRGATQLWVFAVNRAHQRVIELAAPDGPAVMYAHRRPDGQVTIGWRPTMPRPESISRAAVEYLVHHLGLRDHLHPDDVVGFIHSDQADYDRSARENREKHGNVVLPPVKVGDRLVQLIDVRPQLRAIGGRPTDPRLPDRITEPCCDLHGRNCEPEELCCASCTEADHFSGHKLLGPCSAPNISPDHL